MIDAMLWILVVTAGMVMGALGVTLYLLIRVLYAIIQDIRRP